MKASIAAALGAGIALAAAGAARAGTLDTVKKNGVLRCGVTTGLIGFSQPDSSGAWKGFDVDLCRALASAIFDDPTKVKYVPTTPVDRMTVLLAGDIDVLSRVTTVTLSREEGGLMFAGVNYYDGQGFIVRKDPKHEVKSALDLGGASICVQAGSTTQGNLVDYFGSHGIKVDVVTFGTAPETLAAYDSGRCDVYTTDASALYSQRLKMKDPAANVVLPEIISKEPLGPAVRKDDVAWFQLVSWTLHAMVDAEELGVTSKNVDEKLKSNDPATLRLLGVKGDLGTKLGVSNDWVVRILKHVGNYGESFEANLGSGSPLKIARGLNALWTKGGLQYSPPFE
ncbi:MAG: amino acid ABC transporter substrate-binding protein [Hyphomicrobiales bacterium]|nr:amino acid ABC transporter substrate-binding protein [Hyphomicrobiales bacterium]MDE2017697.1 amino acid ABC transporter substrate-binding protein [Hyphomicrobiales bacterium]